jgi:hypothetical protein
MEVLHLWLAVAGELSAKTVELGVEGCRMMES